MCFRCGEELSAADYSKTLSAHLCNSLGFLDREIAKRIRIKEVMRARSGMNVNVICNNEDPLAIFCNPTDTIGSLQTKIAGKKGYPVADIRLSFAGVPLSQTATLNTSNIRNGSTLTVFVPTNGGW
jgi:hypothetical protein